MDRLGRGQPDNGDVYFTLTNNTSRTVADAANPRVKNAYGHIIRWRERSRDYAGQRFTWDLFMLAGPGEDSRGPDGKPLNQDNIPGQPRRPLVLTRKAACGSDRHERQPVEQRPVRQQPDAGGRPRTGELKRFLTGPLGCEVTGIAATPDFRTLFINIQHPGKARPPITSSAPGRTGRAGHARPPW